VKGVEALEVCLLQYPPLPLSNITQDLRVENTTRSSFVHPFQQLFDAVLQWTNNNKLGF
jgi:hypothetical protein